MKHFLLACLAISTPASVFASADSSSTPTWNLQLGYLEDFKASSQQFYYNFSYLGTSLLSHGTAMSTTSDYSAGGLADVTNHGAFLQLTRGIPAVGGDLLSGYNTTPFKNLLKNDLGKALQDFNVVVGVDTQLDSSQNTSYAYGVEYKAIPVLSYLYPRYRMPDISSIVKIGFTGTHNVATDGKATDSAEPTLRAIVGWNHSFSSSVDTSTEDQLAKDYDTYVDQYNTIQKFKTHILANLKGIPPKWDFLKEAEERKFAQACLSVWDSTPHPNDDAWANSLKAQIKDKGAAEYYHVPQLALWAEANARYVVAGDFPSEPWRSIYSLNLKFYVERTTATPKYIQLQFRNGFTEVNPTARTNTFLALAGFEF